MPITKSAQKALRQNKTKRENNLTYLNKMRVLIKENKKLVAGGKTKEAVALLPKIYKALDKAAKENIIKKNTASRYKSRITKAVGKVIK